MARPRRGTLRRQQTKQGISYGVAFSTAARSSTSISAASWEGWTEERAVEEQRLLMAKVNRGEWTPARPTGAEPAAAATPTLPGRGLGVAAPPQGQGRRPGRASKTIRDLEWRLSVVMDKFGPVPIDRVDYAPRRRARDRLCEERLAIERARERGAPLMRDRTSTRARAAPTRRAGEASPTRRSDKALDAAERVLRDAKKRGVLAGEVPDLKSAAPKAERPRRSFLEPEQIAARPARRRRCSRPSIAG